MCADIDECATDNGGCDPDVECINTVVSAVVIIIIIIKIMTKILGQLPSKDNSNCHFDTNKSQPLAFYRRDGLVVTASASRLGGHGFEPQPEQLPWTLKNGNYCHLVRRSAYLYGEGKLNTAWGCCYQWTNPLL